MLELYHTGTAGVVTTTSDQVKFKIAEEKFMDAEQQHPEISTELLHKWQPTDSAHRRAPKPPEEGPSAGYAGTATGRFYEMRTRENNVSLKPHPERDHERELLRELMHFPATTEKDRMRSFLRDLSVWTLVGNHPTLHDKVCHIKHWYYDVEEKRAGYVLEAFEEDLDRVLEKTQIWQWRFDVIKQVLDIMIALNNAFDFLFFPDIKPSNFLCRRRGQSNASTSIVLTDLDDVRRVGTPVATHTEPYRHPMCTGTTETCKGALPQMDSSVAGTMLIETDSTLVRATPVRTDTGFERYSTAVTLLQLLINMPVHNYQDKDPLSLVTGPTSWFNSALDSQIVIVRERDESILSNMAQVSIRLPT